MQSTIIVHVPFKCLAMLIYSTDCLTITDFTATAGITRITMTRMTRVTRMTGNARVNGMTGMIRVRGMTKVTLDEGDWDH